MLYTQQKKGITFEESCEFNKCRNKKLFLKKCQVNDPARIQGHFLL